MNDLEQTVAQYGDMIYRIALNYTRHPHDAEDALQEVLLECCRTEAPFASPEHEKRWLILLAAGPWTLDFAMRYKDATVHLPLGDTDVTAENGRTFTIQSAEISPISVSVELIAPVLERVEGEYFNITDGLKLAIVLRDGTAMDMSNGGGGGGWSDGDQTATVRHTGRYDLPIALEDMAALVICGTEFPLDLP